MTTVCRRVARNDSVDLSDASPVRRSPTAGGAESDYDSARSESELSEQEGENGESPRQIDHDEDRSNPQYIPKRGTFYEHDDRTAASGEEPATGEGEPAAPGAGTEPRDDPAAERRAKPRRDHDKWRHDKFVENEQIPKTRDELIATYGYDIRNEDSAPHARRTRKYGRGPNKYTRQWEDEEAYRRQAQNATRRTSGQEAPPSDDVRNSSTPPKPREQPAKPSAPISPRPAADAAPAAPSTTPRADQRRNGAAKPPRDDGAKKVTITVASQIANNAPQATRNAPSSKPAFPKTEVKKTETRPMGEKDKLATQAQKPTPPRQTPPPAAATPPANQASQPPQLPPVLGEGRAGSKRYSSLRQRPLGENYTPPGGTPQPSQPAQTLPQPLPVPPPAQSLPQTNLQQQPPLHRYVPEFQPATNVPNVPQQQMMHQVRPQHPQLLQQQLIQQQQHAMHNMSQQHTIPGQLPPSQAYPPQPMHPPQYPQYPAPNVYPAQPYPHQIYQHHNYPAHQSGATGVTYYNPVEQQGPEPPRTQRRPTAAIPIVPPPPNNKAGSSEKDSIDRIVDNMFVRKQRPAARASATDKSDTSPSPSLTSSTVSIDSRPSAERQDSKDLSLDSLTLETRADVPEMLADFCEAPKELMDAEPPAALQAELMVARAEIQSSSEVRSEQKFTTDA